MTKHHYYLHANKDLIDYLLLHGAKIDKKYCYSFWFRENSRTNIKEYISNFKIKKKRKYSHIEWT